MERQKLGEIKLFESTSERKRIEDLSDLYAIIRITESIEAAYGRDAVTAAEYTDECTKLISQFKSVESALISSKAIASAEVFIKEFQIECPRAYERLVVAGVPATVLHATNDNRSETVVVAECVQIFITAMDALKLGQRAVDDIQPLLTDLMNSLTRVGSLSPEFAGIVKIGTWIKKLHGMRAVEELSEDDVRQLLFDLDSSYGDFHKHLAGYK